MGKVFSNILIKFKC